MGVIDESRWRFVITDMAGNMVPGSGMLVNTNTKTFTYNKNAGKNLSVLANIDNPVVNYAMSHDCLMKVYRQTKVSRVWNLLMIGDVIQAEETSAGDTGYVTITAADPVWRFQRRFTGMNIDSIGRGVGYIDGTSGALVDNSVLLQHLLTTTNSIYNTGVQLGSVGNCGTTGYLGPVYAQNLGDLMQQICNTLGGPDFELVPVEPSGAMPGTIIATMNIYASLGVSRPNAVFEYGTGKNNCSGYDRILTKDGLCNQAYSPPQGFPSGTARGDTMVIGQDTASQSSIGLYQDVIQSDVSTQTLRQVLANEYVAVRKQARQQVSVTPSVDNPADYTVDYNVGDIVTVRAYVNGAYRFNGTVRVYGVEITIDENDAETVTLTTIPGG